MNLEKYLNEANKKKNAILFIIDQLSNNEFDSDADLILNLAQQTGNSVANISKLVKTERTKFLNGIIMQDKAMKIVKKYIKTGW